MDNVPKNENQVKISFTTWAECSKLNEPLTIIPKENIAIIIFRNIADPFKQTNNKMPILLFIFWLYGGVPTIFLRVDLQVYLGLRE